MTASTVGKDRFLRCANRGWGVWCIEETRLLMGRNVIRGQIRLAANSVSRGCAGQIRRVKFHRQWTRSHPVRLNFQRGDMTAGAPVVRTAFQVVVYLGDQLKRITRLLFIGFFIFHGFLFCVVVLMASGRKQIEKPFQLDLPGRLLLE